MKKVLTILGVVILFVVIAVGVGNWMNQNNKGPGPATPPQGQSAQPSEAKNPPGCAPFEVIAAPGTWESAANDDPVNPHANPNSLMLSITQPLQQEFSPEQVKVWTLPYTAQFRNFNAPQEMSYDDSRQEGFTKLQQELTATHNTCPATKFALMGFSQGAVITGDIASDIGNGRGPIPAENVAGVALIADGRQQLDKGNLIGDENVKGVGAEIALNPVSGLVQPIVPGATMRGPRPDGFGVLNDRVNNFCAVQDLVCDAPPNLGNAIQRARDLVAANAVHAQYATNGTVVPGQTVPQWIVNWARDLIQQNGN